MNINETDLIIISQLVRDERKRNNGEHQYMEQLKVLENKILEEFSAKDWEEQEQNN